MTEYVILLPGDESYWDTLTTEDRQAVYGRHQEFATLLAKRGHTITGGAELRHSRESRTVRRGESGGVVVTDGPYAESVEQLTGFYQVQTDALDDLLEVCGTLLGVESALEVRRVVADTDPERAS